MEERTEVVVVEAVQGSILSVPHDTLSELEDPREWHFVRCTQVEEEQVLTDMVVVLRGEETTIAKFRVAEEEAKYGGVVVVVVMAMPDCLTYIFTPCHDGFLLECLLRPHLQLLQCFPWIIITTTTNGQTDTRAHRTLSKSCYHEIQLTMFLEGYVLLSGGRAPVAGAIGFCQQHSFFSSWS